MPFVATPVSWAKCVCHICEDLTTEVHDVVCNHIWKPYLKSEKMRLQHLPALVGDFESFELALGGLGVATLELKQL